jgi:hypothetical protein
VIRELVTLLRGHGLTRVYWAACAVSGVVSVAYGVTVWCDGRRLMCEVAGDTRQWPVSDTAAAAADLASLVGHRIPRAR